MLGRDDASYEFGSIRINSRTHTIERDGQPVAIPTRAFDMLLLLVQRRGELVSKDELLSKIWAGTHVDEANLPVMISAIRRAIGDDGRHQKLIQTVSKSGYRFIAEVSITEAYTSEIKEAPPKPVDPGFSLTSPFAIAAIAALFVLGGGSIIAERHIAAGSKQPSVKSSTPGARTRAEMWSQKGRYAWNLQTRAGILQGVEYYQNAIAEDAAFAPGYAGLAASYVLLPSYSEGPGDEEFSRARAAALKAVALDKDLGEAHIGQGMVYMIVDRNFTRGAEEFRKAIALDPHSSLAEGELALCLIAVGQTDEAVAHARQAKTMDPLSIRAATDLGIVLYYGHRFTEAETEFEDILKLDPYSYRAHVNLGKTYLKLGRFEDACRVLEQASSLSNHDPLADGLMAEAEGLEGNIQGAKSILTSLKQRAKTSYVSPISFAFAFVGMGRADDALTYLKEARANRLMAALFFKVDPTWDALHGNPRFSDLTKDIALSVASTVAR